MKKYTYDVIVVGGGHAGCEATLAAGIMGSKVLLITMDLTKVAQMSCNPAMGGIAKGQIVREIDAMGGGSAIVTDNSMLQFRMLNRSKGPAMWSPRAQCDRVKFSWEWRKLLEGNQNVDLWQDQVVGLIVENGIVLGVKTMIGVEYFAKSIVLTNGTFLNGLMHIGRTKMPGGRINEPKSDGISEQLRTLGFTVGRMKTGTPARLDGRTINFDILDKQEGDKEVGKFSFLKNRKAILEQRPCYITYTNERVHRILEKGFKDSPLYNGTIKSIGPRYCPSIEDKIVTFASKDSHQLFIEPESEENNEYYLNGFSSSLPWYIQMEAIKEIKGLENVKIFRPGYAIEYDYFDPTGLLPTLESKILKGLFFAGQVNGTTGYEEAAGQGLVAGINAHLRCHGTEEFILKRDEAYIGVLIDDLVSKGVDEPYRMFTSRAEYRVLLRQDNADERLTEKGYKLGIVDKDRYLYYKKKAEIVQEGIKILEEESVKPETINGLLIKKNTSEIKQKVRLKEILGRPEIRIDDLLPYNTKLENILNDDKERRSEILEEIEIKVKYEGYIEREKVIAVKTKRLEDIRLKEDFNYKSLKSLSTEARIKLTRIKPRNIGQAARIPGVSPSDINVLLVHLGR